MYTVIGITGAVGSGKSTVLRWLAKRGIPALDADRVVHGLLADDAVTIAAVASRFHGVAGADGRIDRAALGARVFADRDALAELEALVHPRVREVFRAWTVAGTEPIMAVEAVKLIESGMDRKCDETWLVSCATAIRRRRLAARGWSDEEITRRMAVAAPTAAHLAAADRVVDNSGSEAATERQLRRALSALEAAVDGEAES